MRNLDLMQKERTEILQRMSQAITENNSEAYVQAFNDLAESIQEAVRAEYEQAIQSNDASILAQRGVRQLTSEETQYYQAVIEAMKSNNPKQALSDVDKVLPKTTIDAVFEDLTTNHPLLDAINFQNTGALAEIIISTSSGVAGWGNLTATISNELVGSFAVIELGQKKLSAFIPVAKAMLDLGPAWMDKYVRTLLAEALATELEAAIVDGDGDGNQ